MSLKLVRELSVAALVAVSFTLAVPNANASPVTTYDSAVAEWAVGCNCQTNDHWAVTTDTSFAGGALELGLRAQQRRVGSIAPSPLSSASYVVQTGPDPATTRAWWNFDVSVNFAGALSNLDSLTLTIIKSVGTNSDGGVFNLLNPLLFAATNADLTSSAGEYKASQNPTFAPWFSPTYDINNSGGFAYRFILSASNTDGEVTTSASAEMCVHTEGVNCVPEPSSFSMTGIMAIMLAFVGFAGFMRRRPLA